MIKKPPVRLDEHGVMRVADTHVMLDSVIASYEQGNSAEIIVDQYPSLSVDQATDAIAYYLANRAEVDQYLQRQEEVWEALRQKLEANEAPVVKRLRKLALEKRGMDSQ